MKTTFLVIATLLTTTTTTSAWAGVPNGPEDSKGSHGEMTISVPKFKLKEQPRGIYLEDMKTCPVATHDKAIGQGSRTLGVIDIPKKDAAEMEKDKPGSYSNWQKNIAESLARNKKLHHYYIPLPPYQLAALDLETQKEIRHALIFQNSDYLNFLQSRSDSLKTSEERQTYLVKILNLAAKLISDRTYLRSISKDESAFSDIIMTSSEINFISGIVAHIDRYSHDDVKAAVARSQLNKQVCPTKGPSDRVVRNDFLKELDNPIRLFDEARSKEAKKSTSQRAQ